MKLVSHYNRSSIIISVSILLISGLIYYLVINHIARQQLDDDLMGELNEFADYVNTHHALPKPATYDQDVTTVTKTNLTRFDIAFFDAPYNNRKEKEVEAGRGISALVKVQGQNYIVTIIESSEDTEYLITIISVVTIALTAVLLLIIIVTNTYVLKGLWQPFYHLLSQVINFSVAGTNKLEVVNSKVNEFNELNDAVLKMASSVSSDYQGLKTFTENASHEMMTPLAVITSKLDMMIQDETLRSDQLSQITDIYSAVNKLARLNQSLLLLVKIDNNLLQDTERLDIGSMIIEKAQQFQELIQSKGIKLDLAVDSLQVEASKYLIDVLINNLFSNAIRHNKLNGIIAISIIGGKLLFENSGEPAALNEDIFERFYKGKLSEGTGLGLSIMKNICNLYNYDLSYDYVDGRHIFSVNFITASL